MNNQEISFYVDCMIVEAIAEDPSIIKNAEGATTGAIVSLMKAIRDYVVSKIDPNDKVGSVLNLLAPTIVFQMFGALGFGWVGALLGLAITIFGIDVKDILGTIESGIRSLISSGKPVSSSQVDEIVGDAVSSNYKPATPEEEEAARKKLESQSSFDMELRDARIVKMAMETYSHGMKKEAYWGVGFGALKFKIAKVLKKVLSWTFKTILASAGFMVAGDAVSKFLGVGDNAGTSVTPTKKEPSVSIRSSSQTRFPVNKSYTNVMYNTSDDDVTWSVPYSNTKAGIRRMLLDFSKQVYDGLNGLENIIVAQPGFKVAENKIYWYNYSSKGARHVFIPRAFKSMKQIVDLFIDDVARKAPK